MTIQKFAKYLDSTLLRQTATLKDISELCENAATYNFATVCVNPYYVKYASELLRGETPLVSTVIGFPLGANLASTKVAEADEALCDGASELDMVVNLGAYFSGDLSTVYKEIEVISEMTHMNSAILKLIIETPLLTIEQKTELAKIAVDCGVDYIKTSSGFTPNGSTIQDVILLKSIAEPKAEVKASGGIKTCSYALELIQAGASRIGTSSALPIFKEFEAREK